MKLLKWLLVIVAIIILVPVIYLSVFFNINDYKGQLTAEVEKATGRQLTIADDLRWSFYPDVGIRLGGVSFANPKGLSSEPMVQIQEATVAVALMPLFSKSIQIAEIRVDGLTANLVTAKNGQTSFSGLGDGATDTSTDNTAIKKAATEKADVQNAGPTSGISMASLEIGGISIANTKINMTNQKDNSQQVFSLDNFTLGHFIPEVATPISLAFSADMPDMKVTSNANGKVWVNQDYSLARISELDIQTVLVGVGIPNGELKTNLVTDIAVDLNAKQLDMVLTKLVANNINGQGKVAVNYAKAVPKIVSSFKFDAINLTPWIPVTDGATNDAGSAANSDNASAKSKVVSEPDLSGLNNIDVKTSVSIAGLTLDKFTTGAWQLEAHINKGVANLTSLTAQLYQGQFSMNASLDGRESVPSYRFSQQLTGVQIRPLLTELADIDLLAGATAFEVSGHGRSLIPDNLKKNLQAKGKFEFTDGSLYGVNIPHMIREAQAALKGDLQTQEAEKKTDFSSLAGSFTLANGIANNPDLLLQSPLIRVSGQGDANIINESLHYQLTTKVVSSLKGQGSNDELSGISIPLLITGTFTEPKFTLDTKALLNNKVKDE
ncbi:MAG: AsmA family protein, partial [Shewanella sp.]